MAETAREELARLVDGKAFADLEEARAALAENSRNKFWNDLHRYALGRTVTALAKADAILAAGYQRQEQGWRPIESAPRDGTYILAVVSRAAGRWEHLNGRAFVIRHVGAQGIDEWSLYPGMGGIPDRWFSGWMPLPSPPNASTLSKLEEKET